MSKLLTKRRVTDGIVLAAVFISIVALLAFPEESISAARDGLTLCYNVIIPSLFPFFVLSTLTIELGFTRYFGMLMEPVMRPVFNVSGACSTAFALGFIGGYPVGARTAIELYQKGECTKEEAERLLAFCNNSGPAFILGVVGAGVFSSSRIGMLLYLVHAVSSIIVGILFRGRRSQQARKGSVHTTARAEDRSFTAAFTSSVKNAFISTLNICAFVVFFTVCIKLLFMAGIIPALASAIAAVLSPLGMTSEWAERLLTGLIEISSGVWSLNGAGGSITSNVAMAAFILGWAGLSVHCQVLSFIGDSGLRVKTYILGKAAHGVISAALIFAVTRFITLDAPVAAYLVEQVTEIASLSFYRALLASSICALVLWMIIVCVCGVVIGRPRKKRLK